MGAIGCLAEGARAFPLPDGAVYPGSYPVEGSDVPGEVVLDPPEGVLVEPEPSLPVEGSSGLVNCDCCIAFIAACEIEILPLSFDGALYPGS